MNKIYYAVTEYYYGEPNPDDHKVIYISEDKKKAKEFMKKQYKSRVVEDYYIQTIKQEE